MQSTMSQLRVLVVMPRQVGKIFAGVNHSSLDELCPFHLTNGGQRTFNLR
jgi:hypothetical protein